MAPSPPWTPLQSSDGQPQKAVAELDEQVPLEQHGQPMETYPVYVLLTSHEGIYIAGEVFGVTSGMA